jgi:hypothetical protein
MSTKAGYQEIFAEFVEGVKQSEAQWYSVKPLHNGIPSLADLLEVSSENLQILLMKAGIGNLGKRDKLFSFQSSKFESFCSEYMLQDACESTRWRVKGLKSKQWFVRLGTKYLGDLADPGINGRAPRFHLTPELVEKGIMFRDRVLAHEQYLGMSVTTKSHLMEDHAVQQKLELHGFGDLGEDFGERNHQDQAQADRRLGCIRILRLESL